MVNNVFSFKICTYLAELDGKHQKESMRTIVSMRSNMTFAKREMS